MRKNIVKVKDGGLKIEGAEIEKKETKVRRGAEGDTLVTLAF